MRVFAVSDIHLDYPENQRWLLDLSAFDFQSDILILAGDVTDNLALLSYCFEVLVQKFLKVLFVPGNHELWVNRVGTREASNISSLEKHNKVVKLAIGHGIVTEPYTIEKVTIVPLQSWYDYSFGEPCEKLKEVWADFRFCSWPNNMHALDVTHYFLEQNQNYLNESNQTLISFSHFLPRIDLMPSFVPQKYQYLYPAFGSQLLETQIRQLQPDIHVYGHSHLNTHQTLDNIVYINNAFGYPSEGRIAKKTLLSVYES